jgi:hypothetical protein
MKTFEQFKAATMAEAYFYQLLHVLLNVRGFSNEAFVNVT